MGRTLRDAGKLDLRSAIQECMKQDAARWIPVSGVVNTSFFLGA